MHHPSNRSASTNPGSNHKRTFGSEENEESGHYQQQWRQRQRREQQQNSANAGTAVDYRFALIPKKTCDDLFFLDIIRGCQDRAAEESENGARGTVVCECVSRYNGFPNETSFLPTQGAVIANLTAQHISGNSKYHHYDGIAVSVLNEEDVQLPFALAMAAGIPVVTVDSDAPNSTRLTYIGTDDFKMGTEMAKILLQLRPVGGIYAILSGLGPNLDLRVRGIRQQLDKTRWKELDRYSPIMSGEHANATALLSEWVESNPDLNAIMPVFLKPIGDDPQAWEAFSEKYQDRNLTFVGTDWTTGQLDLLRRGHVHGLVGQLPYEMGESVASVLLRLQNETTISPTGEVVNAKGESTILGTNLIEILRVPLTLPPVDFDYNYLGNIKILGYITFAIVALLSIGFATWTFIYRRKYVVRASQPTFLYIICAGILLKASSIITFGMDDEKNSPQQCDRACMASPWLFSIGFVLVFSALFSKTWRINQLFNNANKFKRLKVTTRDVILPLLVLLGMNIVILSCWTVLNPIRFHRKLTSETDLWNRSIASYGMCIADESSAVYLVLLAVVNIGALVIALVQAYQARNIQTEFSESKYIALGFASMAQAFFVGAPILFIDRHNPKVLYALQTILVFLPATVIILLMFVPKILHQRERDIWEREKNSKRRIHITGLAADGATIGGHRKNNDMHSDLPALPSASDSETVGLKMKIWKKVSQESFGREVSPTVEECHATDGGAVPNAADCPNVVIAISNDEHLAIADPGSQGSTDEVDRGVGNKKDDRDNETSSPADNSAGL